MGLHPIFAGILADQLAPGANIYRGWKITYDCPPAPVCDFDWTGWHPDYDGVEGHDHLVVHGPTREAVIEEIDAWFAEQVDL